MKELHHTDEIRIFRIEGAVDFNPARGILSTINGEVEVPLLSAASSILLLLIHSHGQLVKQDDLIHEGWGRHGLHVSSNTFYQNILILRKGLRECGLNIQVIKTLPKKGLTIPLSISIVDVALLAEQRYLEIKSDEYEVQSENVIKDDIGPKQKNKKVKSITAAKFIIINLITISLLSLLVGGLFGFPEEYTSRYNRVDLINGCEVYISKHNNSMTSYTSFLEINKITCEENESVYFTTYQYIPRTSVIKCKKPLGNSADNNSCISFYYLDK